MMRRFLRRTYVIHMLVMSLSVGWLCVTAWAQPAPQAPGFDETERTHFHPDASGTIAGETDEQGNIVVHRTTPYGHVFGAEPVAETTPRFRGALRQSADHTETLGEYRLDTDTGRYLDPGIDTHVSHTDQHNPQRLNAYTDGATNPLQPAAVAPHADPLIDALETGERLKPAWRGPSLVNWVASPHPQRDPSSSGRPSNVVLGTIEERIRDGW